MNYEDLLMLKENLEMLINEQDPQTGYKVDDTVLKSSFNKRILSDAALIIDRLLKLDFNPIKIDKRKKYAFYISDDKKGLIEISKIPIPISVFTYKINAQINCDKMKKIKASQITSWLMEEGYLDEIEAEDGKRFKILTDKSASIGITSEKRTSKYGRVYDVNLYDENGQRFIINHLEDITKFEFAIPK